MRRAKALAGEPIPPAAEARPEEPKEIGQLRAAYHRALRERDEAMRKREAIVVAVREAVMAAAEAVRVDPPAARRFNAKGEQGTPEVAIIHASDWQLGKVTPSYNSEICEARVKTFAERIRRIAEIQSRDHPVTEARVYLTGDLVEGEGIFPSQPHVVDSGIYRQLMNGQRILCNFILDLLTFFEKVHVVGVIGNHGDVRLRSGEADPESNVDRILYESTRAILSGPAAAPSEIAKSGRLTWNIPDGKGERNWFAVDHVGPWGFLLAHGDQIRGGFAGFPFYGVSKKAWGWIDSINAPWDYLLFGHWHTPTAITINRRQARCNGSTESDNTYAQEQLAAAGHPTQYLGFVHPKHGLTSEYWVSLEERIPASQRHLTWDK